MTLVKVAPSDDLRLILCPESDRRAPFDVAATLKQSLTVSACVVPSLEALDAFNLLSGAATRGSPTTSDRNPPAAGEEALRPPAIRALLRRRLPHREGSRSDET